MRRAVIGIGSNSLRMLVADVKENELIRVLRDREGLRVFAALDKNGNISDEMIVKACESIGIMKQKAIELNSDSIELFSTSAVRDAKNQDVFGNAILEKTKLNLEICSGKKEALLSFIGANETNEAGMIDIGGGSTEIVIGDNDELSYARSLQMGAVRLHRMAPINSASDAWNVVEIANEILSCEKNEIWEKNKFEQWYGVGGTFTSLAALIQNVSWMNRKEIHGFVLEKSSVIKTMEELADLSIEQRIKLAGMQKQRADIIVHGIAILVSCMNNLNIEKIKTSEYGNLEGYIKQKYIN